MQLKLRFLFPKFYESCPVDKIHIYAKDNDKILELMKNHKEEIMSEVLAEDMTLGTTDGYVKEWNINKEPVVLGVAKM